MMRRRAVSTMRLAIASAALVGGALAFAFAQPASASTVPLTFDFGIVLPGATVTDTQRVIVHHTSIVAAAQWAPSSGPDDVVWRAQICGPDGGCSDFADLRGARVAPGTYTVTMSVTMPESTPQGDIAASGGFVQLVDQSSGLASTGRTVPWSVALVREVS